MAEEQSATVSADEPHIEPTSQEQVQIKAAEAAERVRAGSKFARQAALATWQGASSLGEKLVLVGGLAGIVAFFLPWYSVSVFAANSTVSGLFMATNGRADTWLFPISMVAVLFLTWLHLHSSTGSRIIGASWSILIGAAWAWETADRIFGTNNSFDAASDISFGLYLVLLASTAILMGGMMQTRLHARHPQVL